MSFTIAPDPAAMLDAAERSGRGWWRRLFQRPPALIGLTGVALVTIAAIFAPLLSPYSPVASSFQHILAPAFSPGHLLGTDELGRDVLSRLIYGSQPTLEVGMLATGLALVTGVPIGLVSGYYRGALDMFAMRVTDVVLAFPFLLLAIGFAAIFGPSLRNVVVALGIASLPGFVRITRAEAMALREQDYVQAAIVTGVRDRIILFRHLLPNMAGPILVQATLTIPGAILGSALLAYLGLGEQPPTASWGTMLTDAQEHLFNDPWLAILPGLAIFITTLCFNLLGDGLRDLLDPALS
ncbi:MAG TPA: ABC transporter permease [Streptosporangiaceae bacterium]|nr:ABC transporter permease [Streptosporangiaceae bacterium]